MRFSKRTLIICSISLIVLVISLKTFLDSVYRLPVLMYHSIDYTADKKNKMTISPEVFAKQMEYLRENGYDVIPLEKAVSYIRDRKRPPAKTVAITIDDGYEDNYINAYPVLKKYHIPATIFVITDLVGSDGFMTWDEIRQMAKSGMIDIESHTKSHLWLTGLDDRELKNQLEDSKKILETKLGKEINYLCYPMNGYDERVKSAAKQAGYKAAFATKPKRMFTIYDVYEIKRVRISPTSSNLFVFAIKISGYHSFIRAFQNENKNIPYILWKRKKSS